MEGSAKRSTQTKGATEHGLAAGPDAQGQADATGGNPAAESGKGAGAFSARARQRAPTAALGPAGRQEKPDPSTAFENRSDSAGKRGRKMMNGVKRAHGWRVQEGKRDGG